MGWSTTSFVGFKLGSDLEYTVGRMTEGYVGDHFDGTISLDIALGYAVDSMTEGHVDGDLDGIGYVEVGSIPRASIVGAAGSSVGDMLGGVDFTRSAGASVGPFDGSLIGVAAGKCTIPEGTFETGNDDVEIGCNECPAVGAGKGSMEGRGNTDGTVIVFSVVKVGSDVGLSDSERDGKSDGGSLDAAPVGRRYLNNLSKDKAGMLTRS